MLPPYRRSLLSLPPSIRTSIYQQSQQRSFSASSSRKSPLVDAILYTPTLLLDTLHTGLPWHTAIPLSAILIRTLLVYHLSALPARKAAIIRTNLTPLSSSKFRHEFATYRQEQIDRQLNAAHSGNRIAGLPTILVNLKLNAMRNWMNIRSSHRIGKEFGAPVWSWWRSPVNLGVLITMTEAVRVKCGAREGLLNVLLKPVDKHVDPETARRAAMTPDEIMVERLEGAYAKKQQAGQAVVEGETAMESTGDELGDAATTTADHLPTLNTNMYASKIDPTLKTEGLAWFPDLTVADSTLILPLALSTTMALIVLLRPKTNPAPIRPPPTAKKPQKQQQEETPEDTVAALAALPPMKSPLDLLSTSQKFGLTLSVFFFFAAMKLPVAVLLYLMTSLGFGWAQSRWLDLRYPLPEVVRACRRPVRVKVRKEFRDA